jgi:hypothetical protein
MTALISLTDVIEAIELQNNESEAFLNPETGEIVLVTEEERAIIEDDDPEDDLPEWQRDTLPKAREALANPKFLLLPGQFELHEWAVMQRFAQEQTDRARPQLLAAIHGAGAFRRFRAAAERLGLLDSWYRYREEAIKQFAREWLEEHNLSYK